MTYSRGDRERIWLPENLYIIGTMNLADRSLALMDYALRRRFSFITLQPEFSDKWHKWVATKHEISDGFIREIGIRVKVLNDQIAADPLLGEECRIGHSFFTPPAGSKIVDAEKWYKTIVNCEIGPLLDEYWLSDPEKAKNAKNDLLTGI